MLVEPAPATRNGFWCLVEKWLVALIALHSAAIGIGAVIVPELGLRFGGFGEVSPLFFVRQVGIFHLVAANAYFLEYFRYRGVIILLATKAAAVLFLTGVLLVDDAPWIVPFSAAGDAAMGLAVLWINGRARKERAALAR